MYGMISLFVVTFFAGLIFQKEVSVTGASDYSTHQSSVAAINDSMIAAYGDACVLLADKQTPGYVGTFTNAQVIAASMYPLPNAAFLPGWLCEMQSGGAGLSYVVAAFPGVSGGTIGNLMRDTQGDSTYWTVNAAQLNGGGQYSISSVVNLFTGLVETVNPPIIVTSQNIIQGTVIRWELLSGNNY